MKPGTEYCLHGHALAPDNVYVYPGSGEWACRICRRTANKKDREAHREKKRENNRNWYRKDAVREKKLAQGKAYRKANQGKRREWSLVWCKDNPEKVRAQNKRHRERHPESKRRSERLRRTLKLSKLGLWHKFETALELLLFRSQKGLCYYCQGPLDWKNRTNSPLEHMVPLSRGGTHGIENWCLACSNCNNKKHTLTVEEFLQKGKPLK